MADRVSANPPPLVSPVDGLEVRAVLDQDATVTAGLAVDNYGERAIILVANQPVESWERAEFQEWGRSLRDVAAVASVARIVDFGCTDDGRPFLATYVATSLADQLRRVGQPEPRLVCEIGATVADALATAHSYGLVHAAVSPATVLLFPDGVRLAGFGATAPGLTGPQGVWAFTAPEHRGAAAGGRQVGTPAGDVFALAATLCVALAGVLPWSDPTTWADAADLPDGPDAPLWVLILRAALSADPDLRPSAEEFAEALRLSKPERIGDFTGRKVDLRGLIPRSARRLAATSVEAMADAPVLPPGRAVAAADRFRLRQARASVRKHGTPIGMAATVIALIVAIGLYHAVGNGTTDASANVPAGTSSGVSARTLALMASARDASQSFLHKLGNGDASVCDQVRGLDNITTPTSSVALNCTYLMAHETRLLSPRVRSRLADAHVLEAVGISGAAMTDDNGNAYVNAFVSLPYVPSLEGVLNRLEINMSYRDGQWYVVQAIFA